MTADSTGGSWEDGRMTVATEGRMRTWSPGRPLDLGTTYLQRIAFTIEVRGFDGSGTQRVRMGGGIGVSAGPRILGREAVSILVIGPALADPAHAERCQVGIGRRVGCIAG